MKQLNAKEKAEELFDKFYNMNQDVEKYQAKQCALIACDLMTEESRPDEGFTYWYEVRK